MQESLHDCEGNIKQALHMCYPEETLKKKIYLKKACDLSLTAPFRKIFNLLCT